MVKEKELKEIYDTRYSLGHLHKVNKREIELYKKYIDLLDLNLQKNFTHLDIGSGLGHKTIAAGCNSKETLGIDISDKAVEIAKKLYQKHKNINFTTLNILASEQKFNLITSFGLSLLNEKNVNTFLKQAKSIVRNNLSKTKGDVMIIGSFTDFSGENETSWYYHTKEELDLIIEGLKEIEGVKVKIVFPYRVKENYFNYGIYNFLAEVYKRFKNKRKNYFIVIEYE